VTDRTARWLRVQRNPTYHPGALSEAEGLAIRWHSPDNPRSSQVAFVSVFGCLRGLPDRDEVLMDLFGDILGQGRGGGPWRLRLEHSRAELLGETGGGTPTAVDVYCEAPQAVVCVEAKFLHDAREGFGVCSQAACGHCAGYYGEGSDLKGSSPAPCRLAGADGRRRPRYYWELGRRYFLNSVFRPQQPPERCPFAGPHFQVMRNFLFAATAAGERRAFGVLCIAPRAESSVLRDQLTSFRFSVLREEYRTSIGIATYDELARRLGRSAHAESRALGQFLLERITNLL
jgi:hypothetical protein